MATFEYEALTISERLMKGTIEAATKDEASVVLNQMQLNINSLKKAKQKTPATAIGRNEFILFNQQLASITRSGIPLEKGLRELSGDIASKPMQKLINEIADDLESGIDIEQAFESRRKYFPVLYGRILKAGIETGRLSEMLTCLNRYIEVENCTRKIVFDAMAYPAVILTAVAFIMTGIFLYIVPQFKEVFAEMTFGRIPDLTMAVFNASELVLPFWLVFATIVTAFVLAWRGMSFSPASRRIKESIIFKIPLFGRIFHNSILSKMTESMAMMVAAGCDMPECLRLSAVASGSEKLILEAEIIASQIEQGANILEAGQSCRVIPRLMLYSVQLGSQRNELQDNLISIAQMYCEQIQSYQSRLRAGLLPVMIIILGVFVLVTVVAIFLPLVQMVTTLSM